MLKNKIFLVVSAFLMTLWTLMLAWICYIQYLNHLDLKIITLLVETHEVKREIEIYDHRHQEGLKEKLVGIDK